MKRIICLTLALVVAAVALTACKQKKKAPAMSDLDFSTLSDLSQVTETEEQTDYVILNTEKYGSIVIRLYPEVAPETVANFKQLVSEHFYDGLTFHRIIKDFMIQGGDPTGTGRGSSDTTVKGEFSSNGFENNLLHERGVVSMARSDDKDSASCQFFIVHQTSSHLDGEYASFGYVVYGMETVDTIASLSVFSSNNRPYNTVTISSIRFASIPSEAFAAK